MTNASVGHLVVGQLNLTAHMGYSNSSYWEEVERAVLIDAAIIRQSSRFSAIIATKRSEENTELSVRMRSQMVVSLSSLNTILSL